MFLFAVKAFINQYNRIKVAQKQGDSAASSYNIRFEGNPGMSFQHNFIFL